MYDTVNFLIRKGPKAKQVAIIDTSTKTKRSHKGQERPSMCILTKTFLFRAAGKPAALPA